MLVYCYVDPLEFGDYSVTTTQPTLSKLIQQTKWVNSSISMQICTYPLLPLFISPLGTFFFFFCNDRFLHSSSHCSIYLNFVHPSRTISNANLALVLLLTCPIRYDLSFFESYRRLVVTCFDSSSQILSHIAVTGIFTFSSQLYSRTFWGSELYIYI